MTGVDGRGRCCERMSRTSVPYTSEKVHPVSFHRSFVLLNTPCRASPIILRRISSARIAAPPNRLPAPRSSSAFDSLHVSSARRSFSSSLSSLYGLIFVQFFFRGAFANRSVGRNSSSRNWSGLHKSQQIRGRFGLQRAQQYPFPLSYPAIVLVNLWERIPAKKAYLRQCHF